MTDKIISKDQYEAELAESIETLRKLANKELTEFYFFAIDSEDKVHQLSFTTVETKTELIKKLVADHIRFIKFNNLSSGAIN